MAAVDRTMDKEFKPMEDDGVLICRCEEISKGEIRRAVYDGVFTMTEMRRYLRAGMGLCQGQTCAKNVKAILARERETSPPELEEATSRSPVRPVEMAVLANDKVKN